jgi:hypothetical protein
MIKGFKATPETRLKMSMAKKGVKFSDEHRNNIRLANIGKKLSEETKLKIINTKKSRVYKSQAGVNNPMFGKHPSPETLEKMRLAQIGRKHSAATKLKMSLYAKGRPKSQEHIKKMSENMKGKWVGSNHPNWKGGITEVNQSIRNSEEYKLWRLAVLKRDNYTCIWCGFKSKGTKPADIHADHIKPFSLFPELRFAIDNGRTLCVPCHRSTETWGGVNKK